MISPRAEPADVFVPPTGSMNAVTRGLVDISSTLSPVHDDESFPNARDCANILAYSFHAIHQFIPPTASARHV
jgi:hypothetical protein